MAIDLIHEKIIDSGIDSVVSVRKTGLEFSKDATEEDKTLALNIFNAYDEDREKKLARLLVIQIELSAIQVLNLEDYHEKETKLLAEKDSLIINF